jgi:HK97 family phage major capsid protein
MENAQILEQIQGEFAGYMAKATEEMKTLGGATQETKTALDEITKRMDSIDLRMAEEQNNTREEMSLVQSLDKLAKENESLAKFVRDGKGTATFAVEGKTLADMLDMKTTVTTSAIGFPTSGVMPEERGRYVGEARRPLRVRDVIPSRPTSFQQLYWPKIDHAMTKASPVSENSAKPENIMTFTVANATVEVIATWIPASRQALEDWEELRGLLTGSLAYQVNKEEDLQFLSGSGASPALNGLITQATAYDTTLATASDGYEFVDHLALAAQQVDEADEEPSTFAIVHPGDWWKIRRQKDDNGNYLFGGPQGRGDALRVWDQIRIVPTTAISKGTFLVGSGAPTSAEIRDRMSLEIVLSTEHASYFTSNLIAIRAEKRSAMCCYRPAAFITGTFTQSPA